jgi:hypothetical protein
MLPLSPESGSYFAAHDTLRSTGPCWGHPCASKRGYYPTATRFTQAGHVLVWLLSTCSHPLGESCWAIAPAKRSLGSVASAVMMACSPSSEKRNWGAIGSGSAGVPPPATLNIPARAGWLHRQKTPPAF